MGKEARAEPNEKKIRELYEWVQALVCSVLAVMVLFTFGVRLIGVDGCSMLPTLRDGDRLLVLNSMLCGGYEPGDVVVLRKESFLPTPLVKRVVATGGQVVDIDFASGSVFVDGRRLHEEYVSGPTSTPEGASFPLTVPEGSVFVLGDNRGNSTDSRSDRLGTVDERHIIGRAVFLLFPGPDAATGKREFGRIGGIG